MGGKNNKLTKVSVGARFIESDKLKSYFPAILNK